MTDKEKAIAYDEVVNKLRHFMAQGIDPLITRADVQDFFPELAESDDERIRKELIKFVKVNIPDEERYIAWLEKQCKKEQDVRYENLEELLAADDIYQMAMNDEMVQEAKEKAVNALSEMCIGKLLGVKKQDEQTPSDKVEPKFHEGCWVVCEVTGSVHQIKNCIENLSNHKYGYDLTDGGYIGSNEGNHYHLWTIYDAKQGDVLVEDSCIFIIQKLGDNSNAAKTYCTLYNDGDFDDGSILYFDVDSTKPTTKEQRDLFFQKMKEAGYEWDANKKELKRLENQTLKSKWTDDDEQYLLVCKNALRKYQVSDKWDADIISKWLDDKLKQGEQKPKWSEEDDYNVHCCIAKAESDIANGCTGRNKELIEWLKQLKQRMEE